VNTLITFLIRLLEVMFVIGVGGCVCSVIPITAYRLFMVLFEPENPAEEYRSVEYPRSSPTSMSSMPSAPSPSRNSLSQAKQAYSLWRLSIAPERAGAASGYWPSRLHAVRERRVRSRLLRYRLTLIHARRTRRPTCRHSRLACLPPPRDWTKIRRPRPHGTPGSHHTVTQRSGC
jgi:hypothetical protein